MNTFAQILQIVREAREKAQAEARAANPNGLIQSRGVFIAVTMVSDGKEVNAFPGEERLWKGTMKDLRDALHEATRRHPGYVKSFSFFGGFDWRARVDDEDYHPLVSEWETEELEV